MEGNGATVLRDADVEKIIGAHFVTDTQGSAKLSFLVILRGKEQAELRPLAQCACPDAIHDYEQRYSKAKWELSAYEESLSGACGELSGAAESGSTDVADEQSSHGSSDDNDSHLDHIDSDDSYWEDVDDEQGRPGTDPEGQQASPYRGSGGRKRKKALELERMDDEARACSDAKGSAARSSTPPPSSSKEEPSCEPPVHYKIDTIRAALNLPNLGTDAARSMTVASQVFMEELLQRAAFEADRDGSTDVTPEHLKRVAPYLFLHF